MPKFINLSGQKFGKLTVISRAESNKHGNVRWNCECNCGTSTTVQSGDLKNGHTTSCGCNKKTHGMTHTKEYRIWSTMIQRTRNPNDHAYHDYGGRGIKVCDRWLLFENFFGDMGNAPGEEYSIDRINNELGYSPENCRWATRKQQCNNTRRNRLITYNGETKTLSQWAEAVGISAQVIWYRINKLGWEVEKTLTTPVCKLNN